MLSLSFPVLLSPLPSRRRPFRHRRRLLLAPAASAPKCRLSGPASPDPFVAWFRNMWPYVRAHRGSAVVVVVAGEVVADEPCLDGVLQDVALLHGLGIRFVIVPATNVAIERALGGRGRFVGPYRVTDAAALDAAVKAAGRVRQMVEAKLSPGPLMMNLRRHGYCGRWHEVGVPVASGNFLAAKRRGVVQGVDFGATGEVKKVDVTRIRENLDRDCVVILSNLGYSSSGNVLNCNSYEVATACALAIKADKLICIIDGQILDENAQLIRFMTLQDADMWIRKRSQECESIANYVTATGDVEYFAHHHSNETEQLLWNMHDLTERHSASFHNGVGFDSGNGFWRDAYGFPVRANQRLNGCNSYISELSAAVLVCRGGVQRVHLIDGTLGGALLLELFTRDGVGTMVASDVYEDIRVAKETDLSRIKQLIQPLEKLGALVPKTTEVLRETLGSFVVTERDGSLVACAALISYFEEQCGEVAAFVVAPDSHGNGEGEKLLDYLEKKATSIGLRRLFLLTCCEADWFVQQGFVRCNMETIPRIRLEGGGLSRGSMCYVKNLQPELGPMRVNECAATSCSSVDIS